MHNDAEMQPVFCRGTVMPELEVFEAEVKAKIKQLTSKDAVARRKAAEWLGEAGDPMAVTTLAQAYKNDSDPRVREAAGYALGMFRSLEAALNSDKADQTMKMLEDVALREKFGHRLRWSVRRMVKLISALLVSAALIAVAAFVLPGVLKAPADSGTLPTIEPQIATTPVPQEAPPTSEAQPTSPPAVDQATAVPTESVPPTQAVDLRPHLVALQTIIDEMTALRGANSTLNQYWTESTSGSGTLGCSAERPVLPGDYVLPDEAALASSDLALAAGLVNTGLAAVRQSWALFDAGCAAGNPAVNAQQGMTLTQAAATAFSSAGEQISNLRGGA